MIVSYIHIGYVLVCISTWNISTLAQTNGLFKISLTHSYKVFKKYNQILIVAENQPLSHNSTTNSQETKCVDLKLIAVNKPQ